MQTRKQVRRPARAVMCETRDLGIKWPYGYTLIFGNDTKIDMRLVCPTDVKKMLVQTARSVYWKKWAAKHEYDELKEGAWLEPRLALLRKKVRENWTEKHRDVARKIFLESGWTQKRLFDIGWSDTSQCQACKKEEGAEKHFIIRSQTRDSRSFQEPQRRSGSGKEVLLNILSGEISGTKAIQHEKVGVG